MGNMINLTTDDLANLAKVVAQFDRMGIRFNGRTEFVTATGFTVTVTVGFDGELSRHVVAFNLDAG